MYVIFAISALILAGCEGGGGKTGGTVPFLGGTTGISIEFLEGSPPAEVTDGGTFEFDAMVSLRNDGEYDISREDIKVSLYGIDPNDFNVRLDELQDENPEGDLIGRSRDTEGNIIEGTPVYVRFPESEGNFLNYYGYLVGDRKDFTFRANVCYKYQTTGMAQFCVLRDLINVRDDTVCKPNEPKTVYSSGAPVQLSNFKQTVVGKDKIGFSFDIVHMGNGNIFRDDSAEVKCPSSSSDRRKAKDKVQVSINAGNVGSLSCTGLSYGNSGEVTLVNGKRSIMCTLDLMAERSDFEKELEITLDYNYEDDKDTTVLVKHLMN